MSGKRIKVQLDVSVRDESHKKMKEIMVNSEKYCILIGWTLFIIESGAPGSGSKNPLIFPINNVT